MNPVLDGTPGGAVGDDSPRGRLLTAMADAIVEKGFPAVTVADVVRHARTSRRTFYEHFGSREDCYVALLDVVQQHLVSHIAGAVDRTAPVAEQVRQAVEAWIEGSMQRPELTLSWIRDSPSLPSARTIQLEAQSRFVELIAALLDNPLYRADHGPLPPEVSVILVGGLRELIAVQVEAGKPLTDIVDIAVTVSLALIETA